MDSFLLENASAGIRLSIATLTEGTKPMLFERTEFAKREDSSPLVHLGI